MIAVFEPDIGEAEKITGAEIDQVAGTLAKAGRELGA